ncbi:hypothetical protein C0J52_15351 [Blattella germanica]|nr:hypothetical protein C0J52_15351 [Blattella germanica]
MEIQDAKTTRRNRGVNINECVQKKIKKYNIRIKKPQAIVLNLYDTSTWENKRRSTRNRGEI